MLMQLIKLFTNQSGKSPRVITKNEDGGNLLSKKKKNEDGEREQRIQK